jgi:hypothetical protein
MIQRVQYTFSPSVPTPVTCVSRQHLNPPPIMVLFIILDAAPSTLNHAPFPVLSPLSRLRTPPSLYFPTGPGTVPGPSPLYMRDLGYN